MMLEAPELASHFRAAFGRGAGSHRPCTMATCMTWGHASCRSAPCMMGRCVMPTDQMAMLGKSQGDPSILLWRAG